MPTVAKELNADGQGQIGRIRGLDCLKYGLNGIKIPFDKGGWEKVNL